MNDSNLFIHYPGFDPVNRQQLKTFICQKDDIVFYLFGKEHQHWNFDSKLHRDQAFAFLLDQYTDRRPSKQLDSVFQDLPVIENYVFSGTITDNEVILERQNGEKKSIDLGTLEYHSVILDLLGQSEIKVIWSTNRSKPYPF